MSSNRQLFIIFGHIEVESDTMSVLFSLYVLILTLKLVQKTECSMEATYRKHKGKYLTNYVFRTIKTQWEQECATHCIRDNLCASVNYKISGIGKGLCELNNKTHNEASNEGTDNLEFNHLDIIKRVCPDPEQIFSTTTKRCDRPPLPILSSSCKKLLEEKGSLPSDNYTLQLNISTSPYKVYCHMTDIPGCGGGGWTLVMKVDGKVETFSYDSFLWENKETYAIQNGLEGISEKESKLASYWNTPFTKICLGMSHNGETKWAKIDYAASSLYSLIADKQFRDTTAGKSTWESLIAGPSLQENCNREGFNLRFNSNSVMRIGIIANNENDCNSCDSLIGFGAAYGKVGAWTKKIVCGNHVTCCFQGARILDTFGYILVQ